MRSTGNGESPDPDLTLKHSCTLILQSQTLRGNQTLQVCHDAYSLRGKKIVRVI